MAAKNPDTKLPPFDWNYDNVRDKELVAACYWEFARELEFIRDVRRRCSEPRSLKYSNGSRGVRSRLKFGGSRGFDGIPSCE